MISRWFLLLLLSTNVVYALDEINVELGTLQGEGWTLNGVVFTVRNLSQDQPELTLKIQEIGLTVLKHPLQNVTLSCSQLNYQSDKISCAQGNLLTDDTLLDKSKSTLIISYDFKQKNANVEFKQFALAQGKLDAKIISTPTHWQANIKTEKVA
ncbi:MAG: hypothetical protein R3E08_00050 [Thiotrichaceae bacterium]